MQSNSISRINREGVVTRAARLTDRLIRDRQDGVVPHPSSVRKIVVIKPCCLGDMLMATPAIRALDLHFPNAEITVVTDEWTSGAIESNPRVARVISYPTPAGARALAQLGYQLRGYHFDVGASLDRSPLPAISLWIAGVPYRAGVDSQSRGVGLSFRVQPEPNQHETELYLEIVHQLGANPDDQVPEFFVPDDVLDQSRRHITGGGDGPIVVIHPGGAVNPGTEMLEKRWPATSFGELASLLVHEVGARIVLVGSETDRNAVDTVKDFARVPVLDLCGQLSLVELGAICKRASLFVGNDSGVSHLAAGVGTPVVAIFGPTNPNRYRPLGRRTLVCAPPSSWNITDEMDLRSADRRSLPNIASVPLPQVLNASLELLGASA